MPRPPYARPTQGPYTATMAAPAGSPKRTPTPQNWFSIPPRPSPTTSSSGGRAQRKQRICTRSPSNRSPATRQCGSANSSSTGPPWPSCPRRGPCMAHPNSPDPRPNALSRQPQSRGHRRGPRPRGRARNQRSLRVPALVSGHDPGRQPLFHPIQRRDGNHPIPRKTDAGPQRTHVRKVDLVHNGASLTPLSCSMYRTPRTRKTRNSPHPGSRPRSPATSSGTGHPRSPAPGQSAVPSAGMARRAGFLRE